MRFRASHFPFTEPSMEVDINCSWEGGQVKIGAGDRLARDSGLRHGASQCASAHGGLDPDKYQGFAFGMGLDRIAMLKYGIPDLRAFFEADLRWLRHYGFRALQVPTLAGGLSMKFTLSWLKEHLDTDALRSMRSSTGLIGVGLEVEEVERSRRRRLRPSRSRYVQRGATSIPMPTGCSVCDGRDRRRHDPGRLRRAQCPHRHEGHLRAARHAIIPGTGITLEKGIIRGVESNGMLSPSASC